MELSAVTNLKAFDTTPKAQKSKMVVWGVWKVLRTEERKTEVYKNGQKCPKATPALREIAAELGMEVKPEWRTSQLRNNVIKAMIQAGGK